MFDFLEDLARALNGVKFFKDVWSLRSKDEPVPPKPAADVSAALMAGRTDSEGDESGFAKVDLPDSFWGRQSSKPQPQTGTGLTQQRRLESHWTTESPSRPARVAWITVGAVCSVLGVGVAILTSLAPMGIEAVVGYAVAITLGGAGLGMLGHGLSRTA